MARTVFGLFILVGFFATIGALGPIVITKLNTNNGIHNSPSGQAVFLDGEACVVNTNVERTKLEVQRDMEFCLSFVK